jgi:putative endonuclease
MAPARPPRIDAARGPRTRHAAGRAAEDVAEAFLAARGWCTLARNVVVRGGELDLVMQDGPTVVCVEVRARVRADAALESLSPTKLRRVVRAAERWLHDTGRVDVPVRFDVVAVTGSASHPHCVHLEAAFDASDTP